MFQYTNRRIPFYLADIPEPGIPNRYIGTRLASLRLLGLSRLYIWSQLSVDLIVNRWKKVLGLEIKISPLSPLASRS